jgi:hypothetical protein
LALGPSPTAGFIPAGGTLRQRQNAGEIKAWGLEGEASGSLGDRLSLRAAYAYTHARVDGGSAAPQLTGLRPAQTPKLTATAGLDWQASDKINVSADLRYESLRFEDDLNSRELAAGVSLDARAAWSVGPGAEVYLAVENIGDVKLEVGETADGVESYGEPRTVPDRLRLSTLRRGLARAACRTAAGRARSPRDAAPYLSAERACASPKAPASRTVPRAGPRRAARARRLRARPGRTAGQHPHQIVGGAEHPLACAVRAERAEHAPVQPQDLVAGEPLHDEVHHERRFRRGLLPLTMGRPGRRAGSVRE